MRRPDFRASRRRFHPAVQNALEPRVVLSTATPRLNLPGLDGLIGLLPGRTIPDLDAEGVQQILAALRGGVGQEFLTVLRRQGVNPITLIRQFTNGRREAVFRGLAAKTLPYNAEFQGPISDQINSKIAGAVFTNRGLSLAAMMRGPVDQPIFSQYVWAFDRGYTANQLVPFASRPNIRFDASVVVTRAADGTVSAEVRDHQTGAITPLDPSLVKIEGPIVRLVINPALLPSTVRPQGQYRVSFFVRTVDDTRSEHVSSFVPENRMFQVGDIRALRALPRRRV